jgi:hypothetical protein
MSAPPLRGATDEEIERAIDGALGLPNRCGVCGRPGTWPPSEKDPTCHPCQKDVRADLERKLNQKTLDLRLLKEERDIARISDAAHADTAWSVAREWQERFEDLQEEIGKLARFIMTEVPGEPSRDESTVRTAIRVVRRLLRQRRERLVPIAYGVEGDVKVLSLGSRTLGEWRAVEKELANLKAACFDKYGSGGIFVEVEHLKAERDAALQERADLRIELERTKANLEEFREDVKAYELKVRELRLDHAKIERLELFEQTLGIDIGEYVREKVAAAGAAQTKAAKKKPRRKK